MAAPTKLTKAMLEKLDEVADDGLTLKEVCAYLGIGTTTFYRWEAREEHEEFRGMAARVRAGMGSATDDLAWGTLRAVLEAEGEWVEGPDGKQVYVHGTTTSEKVAAAQAILRLRTAHKVELTGKDGGPVEIDDARNRLIEGLSKLSNTGDNDAST